MVSLCLDRARSLGKAQGTGIHEAGKGHTGGERERERESARKWILCKGPVQGLS
jgi:hypothetical protein